MLPGNLECQLAKNLKDRIPPLCLPEPAWKRMTAITLTRSGKRASTTGNHSNYIRKSIQRGMYSNE